MNQILTMPLINDNFCTNESGRIHVLLIEDNPGDARLVAEKLKTTSRSFELTHVQRLADGLALLKERSFDALLLDLNLPDSTGLVTFDRARAMSSTLPIILLTNLEDEEKAIAAVRRGAQDYLGKSSVDALLLRKSIVYAIERMRLLQEIEELAIQDPLTGVFNRRGFIKMAEHNCDIASRSSCGLYLVYADIDRMKLINDRCGHSVGDQVIIETAEILKQAFRSTDIIGRMGGDEFAVLALESKEANFECLIKQRVGERLDLFNHSDDRAFELSISIGVVRHAGPGQVDLDSLMAEADLAMYRNKKNGRKVE